MVAPRLAEICNAGQAVTCLAGFRVGRVPCWAGFLVWLPFRAGFLAAGCFSGLAGCFLGLAMPSHLRMCFTTLYKRGGAIRSR